MSYSSNDGCGWYIASLILVLPIGVLLQGAVLAIAWDWFVVSTFEITTITIPQAMGISIVGSMIAGASPNSDSDKDGIEIFLEGLMKATVIPLFYLVVAWTILQFMA
jgi:hypothetical protein